MFFSFLFLSQFQKKQLLPDFCHIFLSCRPTLFYSSLGSSYRCLRIIQSYIHFLFLCLFPLSLSLIFLLDVIHKEFICLPFWTMHLPCIKSEYYFFDSYFISRFSRPTCQRNANTCLFRNIGYLVPKTSDISFTKTGCIAKHVFSLYISLSILIRYAMTLRTLAYQQ